MVIIATVSESDFDGVIVLEAAALAGAFDDELHVVNVKSYDSLTDNDSEVSEKSVKEQAADTAADAAAGVDADIKVVSVGRIGEPAAEVLDYAETVETRYIVIGGEKRSPVGKALFGSTTQQILLGAQRPVVTVMSSDGQ